MGITREPDSVDLKLFFRFSKNLHKKYSTISDPLNFIGKHAKNGVPVRGFRKIFEDDLRCSTFFDKLLYLSKKKNSKSSRITKLTFNKKNQRN